MSEGKQSLMVYQSRNQWMNNLLGKLGLVTISNKQEPEENDDDSPAEPATPTETIVYDSDDSIDAYLKDLDPKHWKEQDHYKVLGLSQRRFKATDSEIKKSYRKIVLRHHPDKRGKEVDLDCDYYSCITKANEILSDSAKRRSYDSVDPTVDDTIPNATTVNKTKFFEVFGPAFERNARWSVDKDVPQLGGPTSTYDEVNEFYSFWFNFESWREYSYLDEEEKEKGENREERRYLDKQNKAARAQRKKEEMARIRTLVDNAYQCDPRVARFKIEEKKRKQELKQAKQAEIKAKKEEEERLKREAEEKELVIKKQQEENERKRKEEEKKQKEALKKKTKKEMKLFESICIHNNYFADGDDASKLQNMQDVDKLGRMLTLDEIIELRKQLEASASPAKRDLFLAKVHELNKKLQEERVKVANVSTSSVAPSNADNSSKKAWSYEDIQILIKAVKLFPAGTQNRWSVVANYINDKSDSKNITRTHRDVLEKAKELQQSNDSRNLKEEANKNAFKQLETQVQEKLAPASANKKNELTPSERFDAPSSILEVNDTPWTNEEQQLLEQAMKTYAASLGTERWNLIADCIPNRSRADCIKRYKHLVELVKAKNNAKAKAKK